nr:MAG TPA: Vpu protein [Caudoviricetes sp.]
MLHLKAVELLTSPQVFIEHRKIKKKSANRQTFLQLFLILIEIN